MGKHDIFREFPAVCNSQNFCAYKGQAMVETVIGNSMCQLGWSKMMLILFTIARTWKQPRCPLADEWIRKLWYKYTMEYYSAIKNNAFESVLMRCMKLEPIIPSEVSQKEKPQYSILTHIYGI